MSSSSSSSIPSSSSSSSIHSAKPYRVDLEPGLNSWIDIFPTLPKEVAMPNDGTFARIWSLHPDKRACGRVYGSKLIDFPRWDQLFGDSAYAFAGIDRAPAPLVDPYLKNVLEWVKEQQPENANSYRGILLNWMRDGSDYIGPHRDKESDMVKDLPIWSFSYGNDRDFVVTNPKSKFRKVIRMHHNSAMRMGGDMQIHYKHAVPKRSIMSCPEHRINVTVRPMIGRQVVNTLESVDYNATTI